ncbi:MAG: hypothetical protein WC614_04330 [bacterium]
MQNIRAANLTAVLKIMPSAGGQKTISVPALKADSIIYATVTKVLGNNKVAIKLLDNDLIAETSLKFKEGEKLKLWVKSRENTIPLILEILEKPIDKNIDKSNYTKENISAQDTNPDWDEQFAIPINISNNNFIIRFGNKKTKSGGGKSEEFYFSTETEHLGVVENTLYTNKESDKKKVTIVMRTETTGTSSYIKSDIRKLEQAIKSIDWSPVISVQTKTKQTNKETPKGTGWEALA